MRAALSFLERSLGLSRSHQSLKFLPSLDAHRQHPGRRVNLPIRVPIIPANQTVSRTNVIAPIASRLQHVNISTHQTDDSTPNSLACSELLYQLSYVGKICARHYATFPRSRKQIGKASAVFMRSGAANGSAITWPKYLSKEIRAACLKGKRLWASFGDATWCRVKDITVRSWLGDEYRRIRGDAPAITRKRATPFFKTPSGIMPDGWHGLTVSRSGCPKTSWGTSAEGWAYRST
jgi:hypothetical protein